MDLRHVMVAAACLGGCTSDYETCTLKLIVPSGRGSLMTTAAISIGATFTLCRISAAPAEQCSSSGAYAGPEADVPLSGAFPGSIRFLPRPTYTRIELEFDPPQQIPYAESDVWTVTIRDASQQVIEHKAFAADYTRVELCGDEFVSVSFAE